MSPGSPVAWADSRGLVRVDRVGGRAQAVTDSRVTLAGPWSRSLRVGEGEECAWDAGLRQASRQRALCRMTQQPAWAAGSSRRSRKSEKLGSVDDLRLQYWKLEPHVEGRYLFVTLVVGMNVLSASEGPTRHSFRDGGGSQVPGPICSSPRPPLSPPPPPSRATSSLPFSSTVPALSCGARTQTGHGQGLGSHSAQDHTELAAPLRTSSELGMSRYVLSILSGLDAKWPPDP